MAYQIQVKQLLAEPWLQWLQWRVFHQEIDMPKLTWFQQKRGFPYSHGGSHKIAGCFFFFFENPLKIDLIWGSSDFRTPPYLAPNRLSISNQPISDQCQDPKHADEDGDYFEARLLPTWANYGYALGNDIYNIMYYNYVHVWYTIYWLIDCLLAGLVGWLVDWLIDWLIDKIR